jgi:hypothetical protein
LFTSRLWAADYGPERPFRLLPLLVPGLVPLLILVAAGIAWNVFCVIYIARRVLPVARFERAIAKTEIVIDGGYVSCVEYLLDEGEED